MTAWPQDVHRIPTDALAAEFVPQMYSTKVINHVRSNLVAVAVCNTTWKAQLAKGDIVYIPVMSTYSTHSVDPHASMLTEAEKGWGETAEEITIDQWEECPVMIDDSTALQTQVSGLLEVAASNAAYALEKAIDLHVTTLFQDLTATWQGSDGQTFTDDIMIALQEGLDEADVPKENRALVVDPSTVADILKIDKFVNFDYQKAQVSANGFIGLHKLYGTPTYITNNLYGASTGAYGALLHKEAIGVVIQSDVKTEKWREPTRHSDVINVSAIYGADVLRSEFGAEFYTRYKGA